MTQEQADYTTETDDALEMLGAGYEVHPPAQVIKMQDFRLIRQKSKAWIKIDVDFRSVMKKLKGAKLSAFLAISLRINEKGECYPSYETIAEDTGYSLRAVKSAVMELKNDGFLTIIHGEKPSNLYHINFFASFGDANPDSAKIARSAKNDKAECKKEHETMSEIALKEEPINKNQEEYSANAENLTDNLPIDWAIGLGVPKIKQTNIDTSNPDSNLARISTWQGKVDPLELAILQEFSKAYPQIKVPSAYDKGEKLNKSEQAERREYFRWVHGINDLIHAAQGKDVLEFVRKSPPVLEEAKISVQQPKTIAFAVKRLANEPEEKHTLERIAL